MRDEIYQGAFQDLGVQVGNWSDGELFKDKRSYCLSKSRLSRHRERLYSV